MEVLKIIGAFITLGGSVFILLGAIGLMRMPDIYTRIQAGTKASTLGTILTLLGMILVSPGWFGKLLVLIIFVLITNPVSSHVLARAAHHIGIRVSQRTVVDKLAEDHPPVEGEPKGREVEK